MPTREARNAIKIEGWRLSRVPILSSATIYQGDMMAWDATNKRAVTITVSGAPSGATFLGVADHTNPVVTTGMLTSDFQDTRMNVVQQGLVQMIAEATETYYPFDTLIVGSDPQTVKKGSTNAVGFADTSYTSSGKAITAGDYILMWLKVPDAYRAFF
jgi:hypothetical protein